MLASFLCSNERKAAIFVLTFLFIAISSSALITAPLLNLFIEYMINLYYNAFCAPSSYKICNEYLFGGLTHLIDGLKPQSCNGYQAVSDCYRTCGTLTPKPICQSIFEEFSVPKTKYSNAHFGSCHHAKKSMPNLPSPDGMCYAFSYYLTCMTNTIMTTKGNEYESAVQALKTKLCSTVNMIKIQQKRNEIIFYLPAECQALLKMC